MTSIEIWEIRASIIRFLIQVNIPDFFINLSHPCKLQKCQIRFLVNSVCCRPAFTVWSSVDQEANSRLNTFVAMNTWVFKALTCKNI